MRMPGTVPAEMLDTSRPPVDDWKGWKPMDSTITDRDIDTLETEIGVKFPPSYRVYLKYKHFFEIRLPDPAVILFRHLPNKALPALRDFILNYHEPDLVIGRGYIHFADYYDYGLLCFDTNMPAENGEYPVVYIDHEELDYTQSYADNFQDLLEGKGAMGRRPR
jgi:hypothetical protein